MKMRTLLSICFIPLFLITITGCRNMCPYSDYCQRDYWGDNIFDIFGRKNCVGRTGVWVDQNNGREGFYCTSPQCKMYSKASCEDTCEHY